MYCCFYRNTQFGLDERKIVLLLLHINLWLVEHLVITYAPVAYPAEGPGGGGGGGGGGGSPPPPPPQLVLDQNEAQKADPVPPLSQGLDNPPLSEGLDPPLHTLFGSVVYI